MNPEDLQMKRRIDGKELRLSPQPALTTASVLTISTGDADTNTALNNMRTRINELETRLRTLNLIR